MHAMQIVEVFLLKCQLKNYLTYRYAKKDKIFSKLNYVDSVQSGYFVIVCTISGAK